MKLSDKLGNFNGDMMSLTEPIWNLLGPNQFVTSVILDIFHTITYIIMF